MVDSEDTDHGRVPLIKCLNRNQVARRRNAAAVIPTLDQQIPDL